MAMLVAANKVVGAVVMLMVVAGAIAPHAVAAISCGKATSLLLNCIGYLKNGGAVPSSCCRGVQTLAAAGKTTADRQAICRCLKGASAGAPGIKVPNAQSLPGKCKVRVPYKISRSIDCSKVR